MSLCRDVYQKAFVMFILIFYAPSHEVTFFAFRTQARPDLCIQGRVTKIIYYFLCSW